MIDSGEIAIVLTKILDFDHAVAVSNSFVAQASRLPENRRPACRRAGGTPTPQGVATPFIRLGLRRLRAEGACRPLYRRSRASSSRAPAAARRHNQDARRP